MLSTKFRVNWSFNWSRRIKCKINFQDSTYGSHLGFLIGTILALFYLQATLMLPKEYLKSTGLLVQEKRKIDFQDGGHLGFPIKMILTTLIN